MKHFLSILKRKYDGKVVYPEIFEENRLLQLSNPEQWSWEENRLLQFMFREIAVLFDSSAITIPNKSITSKHKTKIQLIDYI